MNQDPIFRVENFGVSFSQYKRGTTKTEIEVITNLDIELYSGKILAVVGSSGSGKSLLAHAIMGILPYNANVRGKMYYKNKILTTKDIEELRGKEISLIPQSVNYLDPLMKVGKQVESALPDTMLKEERKKQVETVFEKYGLEKEVYHYYPHQLSGGMARKVLLATATLANSKIIIADEPTPGLDEVSLNEVLRDFRRITDEGAAVLMITHDVNAACEIADQVAIFYAGSTFEIANIEDMKGDGEALRHPYTKALQQAMPEKGFKPIPGTQPIPGEITKGCLFCDRCSQRNKRCEEERPELRELRGGKVRCHYAS